MKLLIIDDSQDVTDLFVKVLSTIGHKVIARDNGKDGLEIINEQKFDAVFLDIAMPDFSGLDVIDSLLENGKIDDSAIVLFTASSITDDEVNDLIKKGVHSCIRKPVRIETLLEKIDELSQIHSAVTTTKSG
jgi:CheY-like chemotaxis protein